MGYKSWAAGDPLLAADVMSYLMNQTTIVCTSSTRPSLTTEGVVIYETDTDRLYVYNGGWVQMGGSGAWTTWSPTITQAGTVAHTATYARYMRTGRTIRAEALLGITGSGTGSNAITVSLPVTAAQGANMAIGSGFIFDVSPSATNYPAICIASSTVVASFVPSSAAGTGLLGNAVMTAGLATGDAITFSISYEAAAGL
jgi:hypothetical protein